MDERDLEARLHAERVIAEQHLASLSDDLRAVGAAAAGSNLDDEHDPEGATLAFEREQLAELRAQARTRLHDIDAALERLSQNRYGRCESCGDAIGDARLDPLPTTRLCVRCARSPRTATTTLC